MTKKAWNKGLTGKEYLSHYKNGFPLGMLGKHLSNDTKRKIRLKSLGRNHTEKTKKKISEKHKGIPRPNYVKNKISKSVIKNAKNNPNYGMKGKHHSKETKIKLSNNSKININYGFKNKKHLNITKFKISLARRNQILPKQDTSIEIKIQKYLKELNIEFFTHQYIKEIEHSYQCDILIPSLNLVIECDGNYWHNYPIGNNIDHIRTSELLQKGFKVLRLWEIEIKEMTKEDLKNRLSNI